MAEKEVKVSEQHVWVGVDDEHVLLGLTNYIQGALGTVISVELPDIGDRIEEGEVFAEIETISTVHEFVSPISGKVLAVNPHLDNHASIINEDPYSEGWLIEVRLNDSSELNDQFPVQTAQLNPCASEHEDAIARRRRAMVSLRGRGIRFGGNFGKADDG